MKSALLCATVAMCSFAAWGDSIVIGLPAIQTNVFPFGGSSVPGSAATRYQQAYAAADFGNIGPIDITGISFLGGHGDNFATSTYTLYFSTITAGIDSLSNSSFDSNLGSDNTLFASANLSGVPPTTLTFTGTSFYYNPANGNLLLDIIVSPGGVQIGGSPAGYQATSQAIGVFSRYQNFGQATIGWGLITGLNFTPVPEPCEPALIVIALITVALLRRKVVNPNLC